MKLESAHFAGGTVSAALRSRPSPRVAPEIEENLNSLVAAKSGKPVDSGERPIARAATTNSRRDEHA
jgi:hypothetical protein